MIEYVKCENGHFIKKGSTKCIHCVAGHPIKDWRTNTISSSIQLLEGDNIYDRTKNFNLLYQVLKYLKSNGFNKPLLETDIEVEFNEDYVEELIRKLYINWFSVKDLQTNINPDALNKIEIRISFGDIGPLVGIKKEYTFKLEDDNLKLIDWKEIIH